jgi:hypothetical protein
MHRAPAAAAPLEYFLPRTHSYFEREAYTHPAAEKYNPYLGHSTYNSSTVDIRQGDNRSKHSLDHHHKVPLTISALSQIPSYTAAPIRDGLRTPPEDDMSSTTAYQAQHLPVYRSQVDSNYPYAPSHSIQTGVPSNPAKQQQPAYQRDLEYSSQQSRALTAQALSNVGVSSHQPYIRQPLQSPKTNTGVLSQADDSVRRKSNILLNLQIPAEINNSGGSLGEFAAQVSVH